MAHYTIHTGDNQQILDLYPDNHFDAIITDPPYGIEFLGKDWDSNTGAINTWRQCLRVLKPGGYLLAFSAARTYHHLASNIEQVGFEIRDQLMWLYASGFPKAQDVGKSIQRRQGVEQTKPVEDNGRKRMADKLAETNEKKDPGFSGIDTVPTSPEAQQWSGWKTALKPAHEPIVMARKPFKGSTIDNVLTHGVGALNIDATRIALEKNAINEKTKVEYTDYNFKNAGEGNKQNNLTCKFNPNAQGRYPSNVMGEVEGYQKFFYCPKVSRRERHCGFENALTERQKVEAIGAYYCDAEGVRVEQSAFIQHPTIGLTQVKGITKLYDEWLKTQNNNLGNVGNNHPTVKPVALMRYLIELVVPKNSVILDPFTGSGSTGMAACELGHQFVGCELDPHYVDIATKRIAGWIHSEGKPKEPNLPRMCGPGGDQWVHTQHQQHNKPNPQDLFEDTE